MKHPFIVGEWYSNGIGRYEVIDIKEPQMTVRYADGRTQNTDVVIQLHIWERMQEEEREKAAPPPPPPTRARTPARRRMAAATKSAPTPRKKGTPANKQEAAAKTESRGSDFRGFQERDFQGGVAGSSWRTHPHLGKMLAQALTERSGSKFESYPIPRHLEVQIAQPEHYHKENKERAPKFVLDMDSDRVRYGFLVEKHNGPMEDATWAWPRFLAALRDESLAQTARTAMDSFKLRWEAHLFESGQRETVSYAEPTPEGVAWRATAGADAEPLSWDDFVERLSTLDPARRCDLYLVVSLHRGHAIAAGEGLTETVANVYTALLPLYEASVTP